ncbi:unnamed protein product [Staurois parvus]|uniref:Uncharacterized protein n=1 Tax=Staurois parvus TaxID=386267 RepID=A0ABN9C3B9_9NEOB|nr:unnamed protein product [Staurois parvus]CAI9576281.1 unnamed protein product [Staurois parvus]
MVRVTSQGSEQGWSGASRDQSRRSQQRFRNKMQDRNRIQGPGQTQHQGRVCKSGHPLNTPVSSVPGVSWLKG